MADIQGATEELFLILDATLDPDADQPDEDPELFGVPAVFMRKLREKTATWQALGVTVEDTYAAYEPGRIWVVIDLDDRQEAVVYGSVRVEVTENDWMAAWASPELSNQRNFDDAEPGVRTGGPISDPERDVDAAVDWLETQLSSPIVRYVWRDKGEVVAEVWRLEHTGQQLVLSGPPELRSDLDTADQRIQIRP
jgi:hypothetical protein